MKNGMSSGNQGAAHLSVLMMGDSITEGFDTARLMGGWNIANRGVSGDSTEECLARIRPEWFMPAPALLFLCIGTNDLARSRSDQFILDGIRNIVRTVRNHSNPKIVLTSLFPTRGNEPRPNERIRTLNSGIAVLATELGCICYDLHRIFTDGTGALKEEYTEDGLHLTEAAYRTWTRVLSDSLSSFNGDSFQGPTE
jgi:lysophospholipase L1-like esterase